ncbi:MAG: hypothetical protein QOK31_1001 [Solirubrobacteraceae bacterium]|jgi:hypothetical protein|nr:hypothetical protein [Solirubrobacteraceae bacterium]
MVGVARVLSPVLVLLLLALTGEAQGRTRWLWPLRGPLVARFHVGADRFAPGQRRGIDIAAPAGAIVRAACPGRVTFTGRVAAAGRVVAVACGRLSATYLHLATSAVTRGEQVAPGDPVGTVGTTGRPREPTPHLTLGARVRARPDGYVDPLTLLADEPAAPARPVVPLPRLGPAPDARSPQGIPSPRPVPSRAPVRAPSRAPGLPLAALWLPAGFALLIGAFALTAARRLRAAAVAGAPERGLRRSAAAVPRPRRDPIR